MKSGKEIMKRWPELQAQELNENETDKLIYLVEAGWDSAWPGWGWVAKMLNRSCRNNRSALACKSKYARILRNAEIG